MTSMGKFVVITALRSEYAALFNQVPGADLERCGMGPDRVREWLPRLHALNPDIVAVAGVAGGLDPSLRSGDVIVASEVRDEHGRIVLRAAAPLAPGVRRRATERWPPPTTEAQVGRHTWDRPEPQQAPVVRRIRKMI